MTQQGITDIRPILISSSTATELPPDAGGKISNLQRLMQANYPVPPTLFLPSQVYFHFITQNSLQHHITSFANIDVNAVRWEEIWDAALALRNLFLRHPIPNEIALPLLNSIHDQFGSTPLAIRSCAQNEDSTFSHAGMHDSILHVSGEIEILKAVQQVWASLWTDRAILYRKEMNLDAKTSGMGVIIQPMFYGQTSGVLFTKDPTDESRFTIEAISGNASEVVDDNNDTERIFLNRETGKLLARKRPESVHHNTISDPLLPELYKLGMEVEKLLEAPQDIEWTVTENGITILQSRPITTFAHPNERGWDADDKRPWYVSLTRSHSNLTTLRKRIESEILPEMSAESDAMKKVNLVTMSCEELKKELAHRKERLDYWREVYWHELIPFAHTVRQFGVLYNNVITPDDPFEFTTLLSGQHLLAIERNTMLKELAEMVRNDKQLEQNLKQGILPDNNEYTTLLDTYMERFGDLSCGTSWCEEGPWGIIRLTLRDTPEPTHPAPEKQAAHLEETFLQSVPPKQREFARDVLELARIGYKLRDDDNLYLGKIQARYNEAFAVAQDCIPDLQHEQVEAKQHTPKGLYWGDEQAASKRNINLNGWAAAHGIALGKARVITTPEDLYYFQKGEILVCDALDPNMTFVVPMASAIVERRGGMLVHGAIIAREYGIPCVTGIPEVTRRIHTGDDLVVDGFRGVVTIETGKKETMQTEQARNVLGGELQTCCVRPMTGFFRRGSCETASYDRGNHVVCAIMTDEFLKFTLSQGNDLISPSKEMGFPGLVAGDRWCLCALRWEEARRAGVAPPVILEATNEAALRNVQLEALQQHEAPKSNKP